MNCMIVEYPGYGCYPVSKTPFEDIEEDALTVYDYLLNDLGFNHKNIIVFGRSLGSGPATLIASKRNIGMLILMSPYTSLINVAGYGLNFFLEKDFYR